MQTNSDTYILHLFIFAKTRDILQSVSCWPPSKHLQHTSHCRFLFSLKVSCCAVEWVAFIQYLNKTKMISCNSYYVNHELNNLSDTVSHLLDTWLLVIIVILFYACLHACCQTNNTEDYISMSINKSRLL